jgi:hypothetical protein
VQAYHPAMYVACLKLVARLLSCLLRRYNNEQINIAY